MLPEYPTIFPVEPEARWTATGLIRRLIAEQQKTEDISIIGSRCEKNG